MKEGHDVQQAYIPDEYPMKDIPSTKWWSENFFVGLACFETKTSLFYSIGRWHSDPMLWRENILATFPDGTVAFHRGYGRTSTDRSVSGGLSHYEVTEPGQQAILRFDGPMVKSTAVDLIENGPQITASERCVFDFRLEGIAPVWNMKGNSLQAQTMAGSMHIDQICKFAGTISYGEQSFTISDGYAIRDHSRGVRDVSKYAGHNWLNGIFPSGRGFYVYMMRAEDGSLGMSNAAVFQDERIYPATVRETQFATKENGWMKGHRLVVDSELGEMVVDFDPSFATVPTAMVHPYDTCAGRAKSLDISLMFDEGSVIHWNGEVGKAWAERGFSGARG
ncbi:hypothetical protein SAMN02927924_02851 [Sphingobium faniae]|nr:hypothetical protein SAMN02927924_02851 [Sphingobium faniae]